MKLRPTPASRPALAAAPRVGATGPAALATGGRWRLHRVAQASLAVLAGAGLLVGYWPALAQSTRQVAPNALPVLRGVVSGGAVVSAPASTAPGAAGPGRALLTVDQSTQRAILDWRSFDIGRDAEVLFRHALGQSASTLNRIHDANPSIIQGRLTATGPLDANGRPTPGGQVILLNQNGILFDRGAQVNLPSLVASTLNLSNSVFNAGPLTAGGLATPAFAGGYDDTGATLLARPDGTRPGAIVIGRGGAADAPAPQITATGGGSIMVFAPRIEHEAGLISAPDGQVILAAGSRAYLALNDDASDITLRGFRVEVEAARDGPDLNLTNLVRNAAGISADRGNVTLAALAINQEGRISANTAVQANGSIFLQARARTGTGTETAGGRVTMAAGSVTEVMPDRADTTTIPESQDYAPYRGVISATGRTIVVEAGRVEAAGGRITLNATDSTDAAGARVYLGAGSTVSVAGVWADVDPARSLRTFTVTSNELKNAPDQKDGLLRGATVTVDLRQDSSILDLEGYRGTVARTVSERAALGGELAILSSGSVVQRAGAHIDASGGGYRYAGGTIATTRLLGDDGRIYDIGSAPQQRRYVAQLDRSERVDPRYGVSTAAPNLPGLAGRYEAAYAQGLAGGTVTIRSGAGLVLDGDLAGGVTIGPRQRNAAPAAATLRIGEFDGSLRNLSTEQRIGNVTLRPAAADTLGAAFTAETPLTATQRDNVTLAASQLYGAARVTAGERTERAFGSVEINADGRITLPADVRLAGEVGAALTLRSPAIDIAGDIRLPGGSLLLQPLVPLNEPLSPDLPTLGERLTLRGTADLSTAGLWLNNAATGAAALGEVLPTARRRVGSSSTVSALDGGTLTLQIDSPLYQTRIERGAVLDVSGGAALSATRTLTGGSGGSLTVATGGTSVASSDWMQGELRGHALANGGSLTLGLQAAVIDVDGAVGTLPSDTTRLTASLFERQGFSRVTVNATEELRVAAGSLVTPRQLNRVVDLEAAVALPTGGALADVSRLQLLPDHQRRAASVTLATRGGGTPGAATLTVAEGARIATDPLGQIALSAVDGLRVEGQLVAPGGSVTLTLNGRLDGDAPDLTLGNAAVVSARGTFVATPSDRGLVQGTLLGGGTVGIEARNAGVALLPGSQVDVSARSQRVDVTRADGGPTLTSQVLQGHAGTVTIRSQGSTRLAGTLEGHGGSAEAAGGSFALEQRAPDGQLVRPAPRRIVVAGSETTVVPAADGAVEARVDPQALAEGGFERLRLLAEDGIEFHGSSLLEFERGIRLDTPVLALAEGARATLRSAAAVSLGQSLAPRLLASPEDGWRIVDGARSPDVPLLAGTGVLDVSAGFVDLYGSLALQGAALTRLHSDSDIRLIGRAITTSPANAGSLVTRQVGGLATAGNLELRADQVYPATRSDFTFTVRDTTPGDGAEPYLLVQRNLGADGLPAAAGEALSAAGRITIDAPVVVQAGVLRAPFGQIDLSASTRAEFAPDSVTSVSGIGLTVPFGGTRSNVLWQYQDSALTQAETIDRVTPGGQALAVRAPTVDVQGGARIDLRGGGDVLGIEFVPGNGGDSDLTLAANTFAILPAAGLAAMPYDTHTLLQRDPGFGFSLANGRDNVLYDSLTLGAGGALAAGTYALLPARYALLPGATLVQLQTGAAFRNLAPGQTASLANGALVLAGWRSAFGTAVQESQSVGVVLQPGPAGVRRASDYNFNGAAFFSDAAALARAATPRLPWDAASLRFTGAGALTLDGRFLVEPGTAPGLQPGRLAQIDITGEAIAVVDRTGDVRFGAGTLQLAAASLSSLGGSVLLGGVREETAEGLRITPSAREVEVANTSAAPVRLPELTITAADRVTVRAGARVEARADTATAGANAGAEQVIAAGASGALVRLAAAGPQATVDRGVVDRSRGEVVIEQGARLEATGALLVDATASTRSAGELRVGDANGRGGSLALSSSLITLGETGAADINGLVLSNTLLASYAEVSELVLRAYDGIDVLGRARLGGAALGALVLDAPLIRGVSTDAGQAADAGFQAGTITLRHSGAATTPPAALAGTGQAVFEAGRIVLGAGDKVMSGFATATLRADEVRGTGRGSLAVAAPLSIEADRVVAGGGSDQTLNAAGLAADGSASDYALQARARATGPAQGTVLQAPAAAASEDPFDAGGRLRLGGSRVAVDTTLTARSGAIELQARGAADSDGVTVGARAVLDASGVSRDFNGTAVSVDAGRVALRSAQGGVALEAGSRVLLSADAAGGAAGRLDVAAPSFSALGTLTAQSASTALGGTARLDLGRADAAALNATLNAGGFAFERRLRLRSGNIDLGAADTVQALRVALSADDGRIDVRGRIGTGAEEGGGRIELHGNQGVTLHAGSELRADGRAAGARGGEVRVAVGTGAALEFDEAARIDVRAGASSSPGFVRFGTARDEAGNLGPTSLRGLVLRRSADGAGAASVDLEATRLYAVGNTLGAGEVAAMAADHATFVEQQAPALAAARLAALRDEAGSLAGAAGVLGATEVRATGALTVNAPWDLTDAQWLAGGQPGTLTLRAADALTINDTIGGARTADRVADHAIQAGRTWSIRLAAGADLGAADPLATLAGAGSDLNLPTANSRIRTGTGRIDLAAAGAIRLGNVGAAVFTAGRIGAADTAVDGNNRWAVDGGGVSLRAGGDVVGATGAAGELWVNEWLRRPRLPNTQFAALQPTDWWSYRPRFQQAVGTLAGGDIDIEAGGSVRQFSVMQPTSGRTFRDGAGERQVDVQGGGSLRLTAGGEIDGGGYLLGRGTARLAAGGSVGAGTPVQIYLMGVSSGEVAPQAHLTLSAGESLNLQTIANPTAIFMPNRNANDAAAVGPSFGASGNVPTFFTYAPDSRVDLLAASGDIRYLGVLPRPARVLNNTAIGPAQTDYPGAWPASFTLAALDGDITGPPLADRITTFPSTTARAAMLAGGSLIDVGFHASDRDPATVITPSTQTALANGISTRQLDGLSSLQASGVTPRLVERSTSSDADAFVFQMQALNGSFLTRGTATETVFSAPGLVYAGLDIVGAALRMQNLEDDDLSVVRARTGDFRSPLALEVRGPGRLLLQAGRNIDLGSATLALNGNDLGGVVATGNAANPSLRSDRSARLTLVAGTPGDVNLAAMDAAYGELTALNLASRDIVALYDRLAGEGDTALVLAAPDIATLAQRDPAYARWTDLDRTAPRALRQFQATLRAGTLPLSAGDDATAAAALYRLLNSETDFSRLQAAPSLAALAAAPGGEAYREYATLGERYPLLYSDYVQRRAQGAQPRSWTPIVFSQALSGVTSAVVDTAAVGNGSFFSFGTSVQTYGGSDIDLWAPGGNIVLGLTTPGSRTVGVLTNAGGAIRSVLSGDLDINQGKVITAQGGDILMFSAAGSIDAGRGARTSLTTPAPQRRPILDAAGNVIGIQIVIPASAAGSGIQTLSSDPDGLGPRIAPAPGSVFLFAPAGAIDAGEAGIRSSGNIVLNAQTVRNASNISSGGTAVGVPVLSLGSLATALASSGTAAASGTAASEEATRAATAAARQAANAAPPPRATILSVEVLGFGDKNCKEDDKECFAK